MATVIPGSLKCTVAFKTFRENCQELFVFIATISEHADIIDKNRKIAAEALAKAGSEQDKENWEKIKNQKIGYAKRQLNSSIDLQRKIVFVQAVDYFLVYIAELLKTIHLSYPAMLKLDEKISYSEISEFTRMSDLIGYMIDKRVQDLSFKSLFQLDREVSQKHGFEMFRSKLSLELASLHVEKRNLLVHNGGVVNRRFLERTRSRYKEGDKLPLGRLFDAVVHLELLARSIDHRAIKKFNLKKSSLTKMLER